MLVEWAGAYEYGRVVVSLAGLVGALGVWHDAWGTARAWREPREAQLLYEAATAHGARAAFWVLVNAGLLVSAATGAGLSAPEGRDWQEGARIVAIISVSLLAALAPWHEWWRRGRLRHLLTAAVP